MSDDEQTQTEGMPYYDGEKGWVVNDFYPPRTPMPTKHSNAAGGWVFAEKVPTTFQAGPQGWVSESWRKSDEDLPQGPSHEDLKQKPHKGGKRGWVAYDYEKPASKTDSYDPNPNLPIPRQATPSFVPPISIVNGEKTLIVQVELPGVRSDTITIEIVSQTVQPVPLDIHEHQAIVTRKATPAPEQPQCFLLVRGYKYPYWQQGTVIDEREYGFFERCIFLGHHLNKDSPMFVKYESGILLIFVSKPKALPAASGSQSPRS
jgi:HSP20 family molecular chaperone IbpA